MLSLTNSCVLHFSCYQGLSSSLFGVHLLSCSRCTSSSFLSFVKRLIVFGLFSPSGFCRWCQVESICRIIWSFLYQLLPETGKLRQCSKSGGKNKSNKCNQVPCPFLLILVVCKFVRYATWLSVGLAARKAGSATNHPGGEWALASAPEDFVLVGLKFFIYHVVFYHITCNNVLKKN